jgi:hypothetical protein
MGTTVMSERLAPAAALLRLAMDEPRFPEAEVTRERDLMIEEARQVPDDTFRYPFQLAFRCAFGDTSYGLPAGGLEETLQRVERFARLGPPEPRPFDLAAALGAELDARQSAARLKSLVVLRELDAQAPPLVADESQVRLAIRSLLDLALRLGPRVATVSAAPGDPGGSAAVWILTSSPEEVPPGRLAAGRRVPRSRDRTGPVRTRGRRSVRAQDSVILVRCWLTLAGVGRPSTSHAQTRCRGDGRRRGAGDAGRPLHAGARQPGGDRGPHLHRTSR